MTAVEPFALDQKLGRIRSGRYTPADFIIADAKDGDMSGGVATPGEARDDSGRPNGRMKPLSVYRDQMKQIVTSEAADIMLMSLSSAEALHAAGTFKASRVTPAVRLNDATDIWNARGSGYREQLALPFRTARLEHARKVADLGLYAITFYNDLARDVETLDAYNAFREDAESAGMRHFLEVFNPAFTVATGSEDFGHYLNDAIARCLAGVARAERPLFLKMPYNGARAMEELASFDPENLIVGILGGAAGTTRDTFELVSQAERHGARVALFGRKIYFAEASMEIIHCMRRVVQRDASPAEAVRQYHDYLARNNIRASRPLEDDLQVTEAVLKAEA